MKLWELSGQTQQTGDENPALRTVVINEMRLAAPVFEFAEFYEFSGNADTPRKSATAQGGATRTLNNDYVGVETTPTFGALSLKIYGDLIKTDLAHERRGQDIGSERVRQLVSFAKSLGRHVQDHLINGDTAVSSAQFDGLLKQIAVDQVRLFDGEIVRGTDNTAKKSHQKFLEMLDTLIESVSGGPVLLMMNGKMIADLKMIAREYFRSGTLEGALGQQFNFYGSLPIVNAGYNKDESALVIPNTEQKTGTISTSNASTAVTGSGTRFTKELSVGDAISKTDGTVLGTIATITNDTALVLVANATSTNSGIAYKSRGTSIYAIRFGEKEDVTLGTNVGVQVRDRGLVGVHYQTLVDFDLDLAILNPKAAWRLGGIRLET